MRARSVLDAAIQEQEERIRDLEHEVAVALRSDGAILVVKAGIGSSVSFTDAEMAQMRGAAIFTHNHPAGNSFSPQDVATACTLGFGELRVVTREWTHVLRPGTRTWTQHDWTDRLDRATQRAYLGVTDEFQAALARRRLTLTEANTEFWHRVWERVAVTDGLDYMRYRGDPI